MSRAIRRHHEKRLKAREKRKWSRWLGKPPTDKRVGMAYHTPCICSCHMCGNARHYHGATRQEIRAGLET